jgi:hypothetical protein
MNTGAQIDFNEAVPFEYLLCFWTFAEQVPSLSQVLVARESWSNRNAERIRLTSKRMVYKIYGMLGSAKRTEFEFQMRK